MNTKSINNITESILSGANVNEAISGVNEGKMWDWGDPEFYDCKDTKIIGDKVLELLGDMLDPFDDAEDARVWMHDSKEGVILCLQVDGIILPDTHPEKVLDTNQFKDWLLKQNTVKKNKIKTLGRMECVDICPFTFNFLVTDYEGKGDLTSPREVENYVKTILKKLGFKEGLTDFTYKSGDSFITADLNVNGYFPGDESLYLTFIINDYYSDVTDDESFLFKVEMPYEEVAEKGEAAITKAFNDAKNSDHFKKGESPERNEYAKAVAADIEWELKHPDIY